MGLVDYGSSGEESEGEETIEEGHKVVTENVTTKVIPKVDVEEEAPVKGFGTLPRPHNTLSQDIAWTFLDKGKLKIYAPAIPDSANDLPESDKKKKLKASKKGCGLFAILPSPKNQFVMPAKRPPPVSKALPPPKKRPLSTQVITKTEAHPPDEFDIEDGSVDFFSLAGSESPPPDPIPDDMFNISTPEAGPKMPPPQVSALAYQTIPTAPALENTQDLDTDALSALCGIRPNRRSVNAQPVEIIDIDQSSLVADPKDWLTKELSREQTTKSHKRRDCEPTSQQRRKHQITYLAFQAKEQELELKNQWANNRMTRKQTQAKYGF